MPRISERKDIIGQIDEILKVLILDGQENSADFEEMIDRKVIVETTRYINLREMCKRNKHMNYAIFSYGARDFRQVTRMDEASFILLHAAIKDHPVFHNASQNKQTAVWIQLLVTLQVIGLEGNGAFMTIFDH